MPTPTYDLIASSVLGSSAATIEFSSIPATYRDLVLVLTFTAGASSVIPSVRINGDTATNYSRVRMVGDGSTATSAATSNDDFSFTPAASVFSDSFTGIMQFMDYSATDKHKTALTRSGTAGDRVFAVAQRWANTNAITTLLLFSYSANYPAGTTAYLYGIVS